MAAASKVLLAVLAVCSGVLHAAAGGVFDVTQFGAVGDGTHKDTAAVRKATAALAAAGGGTLKFPARAADGSAATYLTGAFNLSVNTYMEVESGATVLGSQDGDDWPLLVAAEVWPQFGHGSDCTPGDASCRLMHQAFVFAWKANNLTIGGGGTIDANGSPWWACAKDLSKSPCNGFGRPHLMMLSTATGVELRDITVKNSPDWTLHMSSISNLHVHNVQVINPSNAPNSDGIDCDCVQNALIENSFFDVGDDALCVKSGIDYFGRLYGRPSENITFQNISIGHGHGISIGSESSGGVKNITFDTITMQGTGNGPRIKSQRGRGGTVEGITYRNIVATDVEQMIDVTLNYHSGLPKTNATATPKLRDVLLENVTFVGGDNAGIVDGLEESHIENIEFRNVDFNGGKAKFKDCDYVDGGKCTGSTNVCPPCFDDLSTAGQIA